MDENARYNLYQEIMASNKLFISYKKCATLSKKLKKSLIKEFVVANSKICIKNQHKQRDRMINYAMSVYILHDRYC